MGYMELMARAQNIEILGKLVDNFVRDGLSNTKTDVESVFDMEDGFRDTIWMKMCIGHLRKDSASSMIIDERYLGPEYDLDLMLKLPTDSLGYTYAKLMSTKKLHPHFYRDRTSTKSETDYVTMRVRKTHDMYHILSGFDMQIGEVGTIALNVIQYGYPSFMLIELIGLTMACFPTLAEQKDIEKDTTESIAGLVFDTLSLGIKMGREAKPLFPVKFEDMYENSLNEVRKKLNITPVKEGPTSWYQDPVLKNLGLS
jgi:ubiquinone biosynthesis protein COQ4